MTYDVIIVGGGIAGLSAAFTLTQLGQKVALCEASDRLGGRCLNLMTTQRIDDRNPLKAVLKDHIQTMKLADPLHSEAFDTEGHPIALATLHRSLEPEYSYAIDRIQKAKQLFWRDQKSLASILGYQNTPETWPKIDSPDYWARKFITATVTEHTGANIEEISLLEFMLDEWGNEDNYILTQSNEKLITALYTSANASGKLSCLLNTRIIKIEQPEDLSSINEAGSILVSDNQGKTYSAEAVVMAVPFSLLKHQKIQFLPALSGAKQQALKNFKVSYYNAVILEFEHVFWDKDAHYLFPNGSRIEDWSQYLNAYYFDIKKKPVLIAQFSGRKALFQHQSDETILEQVLAPLKRVYKDRVTPLKSYFISRFDTDPNILGGSLFCSMQNRIEDFSALAKPEGGIYFAGDYTHAKRHGRLEAAFGSGTQAGLEVHTYLHYKKSLALKQKEILKPKP